jgi:hypothetical protein
MLTVIVSGRNDDYGGDFRQRLFRTTLHNSSRLYAAGIDFEYVLAEWNPLPDRPALSEEFVARTPRGRAVIVPPEVHRKYSLNPKMPFHEMAAKNAALRRARGELVIVTNADILFSDDLVRRVAAGGFAADTLYRAHRIDVKPELRWDEMQNPENQLSSGEGMLWPPWYLGAGGDFCLAARGLWHSLRGFNEHIRFSTRAKDWQFFLSAAEQGIGIEFIGDVYHLDHKGGFRNTSAVALNTDAVHFGRWWDIEFGLPVTNSEAWGFHSLKERQLRNHPRITVLESQDYAVSEEQNAIDRSMIPWLTRSADTPDTSAALLLHAICAAHRQERRLICRIEDRQLLATLSGFDAVASRFSVQICCNWKWPRISGYNIRPFESEPMVLDAADWIFEENAGGIRVYENGSARDIDIFPKTLPVTEPEFNPMLARRLLRACLQLQSNRNRPAKKIAIYGAGGHTKSLLQWGIPDNIELESIVDSRSLTTLANRNVEIDAVLLSSSSFETDMLENCRKQGIDNVIALYGDWPSVSAEIAS